MKILILLFALNSLSRGLECNCTFIKDGPRYSCDGPLLSKIEENQEITAVYGEHLSGKSNIDVESLYILDVDNLTYIPRGVEKLFPNINTLYIVGCNVSNLVGNELDALGNLTNFGLTFNYDLGTVPASLFNQTPLLKVIDFRLNNIRIIDGDLLGPLKLLQYANFEANDCIWRKAKNSLEIYELRQEMTRFCSKKWKFF